MLLVLNVRPHPALDILITELGDLMHPDGGVIIPCYPTGGYCTVHLNGKNHMVHILVAECWHPNPNNLKLVNHKDGDKHNHHPDNLEWCSYSDNIKHAYAAGLRTDNNFTYVRDLRTDEVTEHVSQASAARHMSVNPGVLCEYLKTKQKTPFRRFYEIRFDKEWRFTFEDTKRLAQGASKRVVVTLDNGEIVVYPHAAAFIRDMLPDMNHGTAAAYMGRGIIREKTGINAVYEVNYEGSLENAKFMEDHSFDNVVAPVRVARKVRVSYLVDGKEVVEIYDNLRAFCDKYKLSFTYIAKIASKHGMYGRFHITYID